MATLLITKTNKPDRCQNQNYTLITVYVAVAVIHPGQESEQFQRGRLYLYSLMVSCPAQKTKKVLNI